MKIAWKAAAADLLFPPRCTACLVDLPSPPDSALLCAGCRSQIGTIPWLACIRCSGRTPRMGSREPICMRCQLEPPAFDATWALGSYQGLLKRLVLQMKTDASESIAACLAHLLAERFGDRYRQGAIDAVTSIPSHPWRRIRRGADGPSALARRWAAALGTKSHASLLKKRRNMTPQKDLSREGRKQNVRGGLVVGRGYHLDSAHIVVVDDVLTTGATCHEAARALKKAGAACVTIVVVGRASADL